MKKRVNIEFSHVYLGQTLRKYHINGAKITKIISSILRKKGFEVVSNVWIDDCHPKKEINKFTFAKKFIQDLGKKADFYADFFAFESEVKKASMNFLKTIPTQLIKRKNNNLYVCVPNPILILKNSEHICCFLSATYALAKLGLFKIPFYKFKKTHKRFYGDIQITILPTRYYKEELNETKTLIKISRYKDYLNKILWIWYGYKSIPSKEQLKKILSKLF